MLFLCCKNSKDMHFLFLFFLFVSNSIYAQYDHSECGSTISSTDIPYLLETHRSFLEDIEMNTDRTVYGDVQFIPTTIYIIRRSDGTGGISVDNLNQVIDEANAFYEEAKIQLQLCYSYRYINSDYYYDFTKAKETLLYNSHRAIGSLNIYFANTVSGSSGNSLCGYAAFPGGRDIVLMKNSCAMNGSTFIHELGHYFGLYHTHETAFGDEAVDGSDCSVDGDLICDTPADPKLGGSNSSANGCTYTGTVLDEHGDFYSPKTTNVMSYMGKACRTHMTYTQMQRANWTVRNLRAYLFCNSNPLTAQFYYETLINECAQGLMYRFYNSTIGNPDSSFWDFGDGVTRWGHNVNHYYANPGSYQVTLTSYKNGQSDTKITTIAHQVMAAPFVIDFEGPHDDRNFSLKSGIRAQNTIFQLPQAQGGGALLMEGTSITSPNPSFYGAVTAQALDSLQNPHFKTEVSLCVDATSMSSVELSFDLRQLVYYSSSYSNFQLLVNGTPIDAVYRVSQSESQYTNRVYNLDAYAGSVFKLTFKGSYKYSTNRSSNLDGCGTFIDNIEVRSPLVSSAHTVDSHHSLDARVYPNPNQGHFELAFDHEQAEIELQLIDATGRVLLTKIENEVQQLPIYLDVPNGLYYLMIRSKNQQLTKTIHIQR